ncbi:MAG: hypothetical protein HY898_10960 [Deltaproteobacteria bacterium]|nr:hypothetical protein [Deltaproteobacteria bacterium]
MLGEGCCQALGCKTQTQTVLPSLHIHTGGGVEDYLQVVGVCRDDDGAAFERPCPNLEAKGGAAAVRAKAPRSAAHESAEEVFERGSAGAKGAQRFRSRSIAVHGAIDAPRHDELPRHGIEKIKRLGLGRRAPLALRASVPEVVIVRFAARSACGRIARGG